jgi:hypothetical protein
MQIDQRLLGTMSDHILEARHDAATADFCDLVKDGAPALELERQALRTASPFLNVPAHVMVKPDGEVRSVNYDHTILGVWRSIRMGRMMPRRYEMLPAAQAMWYLPQGLDIWSQIQCEFPGHYSREQEKCPVINLQGPRQHFDEYPPLTDGSFDDRLHGLFTAIYEGDKVTAFRLFIGLADEACEDETKRRALEAQVLCSAIIDLPGPRQLTGLLVNPAHKAIRARAMVDVANAVGWANAYPAYFVVIPDLANNPRNFDLFEMAHALLRANFGPDYHSMRSTNTGTLNQREIEQFLDVMLYAEPDLLFKHIVALLKAGTSLVAINDVAILGATRVMGRIENPGTLAGFFNAGHCLDYSNVVGFWLRNYDHPHQVKSAFYGAHFVNDTSRFIRHRVPFDPEMAFEAHPADFAAKADGLSLKSTLVELSKACDVQDAPLATALVDSYMRRTTDRQGIVDTMVFNSAKWEGDPHIARCAMTHHEEYQHSTLPLPLRDDLFRSWVRYVSRAKKRSYEFNCLSVYEETLLK